MYRREFMAASAVAACAALHSSAWAYGGNRRWRTSTADQAQFQLDEITLQTETLADQKRFYTETLSLPLQNDEESAFSVQAGQSRLTFQSTPASGAPFYHFAFNIPENMLPEAMKWMENRTPLLNVLDTSQPVATFKSWNAHAVYFLDPAGNIVEFIARHDLPNASNRPFSSESLLNVSEIGLVVDDVPNAVNTLHETLGLDVYVSSSPVFTPVGDPNGLLIVVKKDRKWFPDRKRPAEVHAVNVKATGMRKATFTTAKYPYRINVSRQDGSIQRS